MNSNNPNLRIVHSENAFGEIWSRLSYFESEHNTKKYLENKFSNPTEDINDTASSLAFTMQTAKEYYESAGRVSLLTEPLLIFYGMTALSKALFISTYGKKSPSRGHGLSPPKPEAFSGLSTRVKKKGTFPQFHSCYNKQKLFKLKFMMKELLSLVPEIKVEYETVYCEKSLALKIQRHRYGAFIVDTEIDQYRNLKEDLTKYFPKINSIQEVKKGLSLCPFRNIPTIRALSGEEYLNLPLGKYSKIIFLPEMTIHFLIMYMLGMIVRYHLSDWGRIIQGEESGEIYVVQKLLEVTTRKFPNLILNKLRNRDFVFVSPQYQHEKEMQLSDRQKEEMYRYISERIIREARRRGMM